MSSGRLDILIRDCLTDGSVWLELRATNLRRWKSSFVQFRSAPKRLTPSAWRRTARDTVGSSWRLNASGIARWAHRRGRGSVVNTFIELSRSTAIFLSCR